MACFLVPAGETIVTTVVQKVIEKREKKSGAQKSGDAGLTWSRRLGWLNQMLWGDSLMLAIDHLWHGEISLMPPFLTAANSPDGVASMLHEMATVGVSMAAAVTAIWGIAILVIELKTKAAFRKKAYANGTE
jgi:hypothetical protein